MVGKKISLTIGGSRFDIDLEEKFATYLEKELAKSLELEKNNEIKTLLQAYVKKNYELYTMNNSVEKVINKFTIQ